MAVPFRVSVNEKEVTMASLRDQLRGGMQYTWEGWAEAANYSVTNKIDLEQGLRWADASVGQEERYDTLMLKAQILKAMNRDSDASTFKNRALGMASATQLYFYGRQLQLVQKKTDEAMEIFRQTAQRYSNQWVGHVAQARVNSAAGDYKKAAAEMKAAAADAPEQQKPTLANYVKRLEAGEDINK
jgi:tetratricopeptide (TPR) repeat protein